MMKRVSTIARALLFVSLVVLVPPRTVRSEDNGKQNNNQARTSSTAPKSLSEELAALRAKVAQLEAALKEKHQGQARPAIRQGAANRAAQGAAVRQPRAANATRKRKGMKAKKSADGRMKGMSGKGMLPGKGMGMGTMTGKGKRMGLGRKGMGMMGRMTKMPGMAMPSALPGFPGASHIYHIGSTGFFLDHGEHITLSRKQETKINQCKERALLNQATLDRQIEEAEQELWILTGSDEPDAARIDAQVRKIAKLQGDQRIAFIRAVGEAAKVLTDEQRKILVGQRGEEQRAIGKGSTESTTRPNE